MRVVSRSLVLGLLLLPAIPAPANSWARAAEAPLPETPEPKQTPLPAFENPLFDAEVGETLRYRVREVEREKGWVRYFEERVLARKQVEGKDAQGQPTTKDRVLFETLETDATGEKVFNVDNQRTGWFDLTKDLPMPPGGRWVADKQKDEILYLGSPPTAALRCVRRFREAPAMPGRPEGQKEVTQLWYSHDLPVTGCVKRFPAQGGGERYALDGSKRLTAAECAERAERYPDVAEAENPTSPTTPTAPTPEGGMAEPGMDEPAPPEAPGLDEPGMGA
jgi:hypothetical protein